MRVKTDAKRQEILDAASAVLRERGFAGASMAAVSKRIGASKATLYRYFSSREDLFLTTLLDAAHDETIKLFDMLRTTQDLRLVLERFGVRFLELTLSPEVLAVRRILIAEGSRSGLGQRLFDRGAKISWSKMADFLRQSVQAGRLRDEDPWMMAMHLRGLLEADIVTRALLGADIDTRPAALKRCASAAVDVMLRAYGAEVAAQMAATFGGVD
jgi:AcrR family transcriptional regulator